MPLSRVIIRKLARRLLLPLLALAGLVHLTPGLTEEGGKPGDLAPEIRLRDMKDNWVSLSQFCGAETPTEKARIVLLDFFRTDCTACKQELPNLVRFAEAHRDEGIQVVMVALLEDVNGRAKLSEFLKQNPLPFLVLVDQYGHAAKQYLGPLPELPSVFFVDPCGIIRYSHRGKGTVLSAGLMRTRETGCRR